MEIVYKSINELKPYQNNSRTHDKEQIEQICKSIKEYGWTNPVLIDEKGMIIAGHGRVEAGKKLDIKEVPCIVLSGLTETQKKAYVIADNKMALNAGWNEELLKIELRSLQQENFDLGLVGFDEKEIEKILGEIEIEEEPEEEFTEILNEEHNYIILYFDNEIDWLQAESLFNLKKVKCPSTRRDGKINKNMKRVGLGRVLKGSEAIKKIIGGNYENFN